ncbi:hypothetical protein ACFQY4_18245 [Catellatospora bangladeshensis]|uniref:hypothetical protein n=1 Tax=Catellatospora bangladeshensis TaxID=310355 RepID=UPI00360CF44F
MLRLPASGIDEQGIVDTGEAAVALVACTTLNIGLRTGDEQAALLAGYGRWLNSLTGPVQVVVSTQRVDLSSHAQRITERADLLTSPALAAVAVEYARFLSDLAEHHDPLWRTVTIAVTATATGDKTRSSEATRRAEQAATALTALGASAAVLDGARATAVLTTAVDLHPHRRDLATVAPHRCRHRRQPVKLPAHCADSPRHRCEPRRFGRARSGCGPVSGGGDAELAAGR